MGTIMIRCPSTGPAISTGKEVASAVVFRSMAVFLAEHSVRTARSRVSCSATRVFGNRDVAFERQLQAHLGCSRRRIWGVQRTRRGAGEKEFTMCDFSLQSVRSRPAKVGDKLVTRDFGTGTRGFAAADDLGLAVCLLPGTELAFSGEVACLPTGLLGWRTKSINHRMAIFRQVNKDKAAAHHDALEFPDGRIVLLTLLRQGQTAVVLQLPAQPKTEAEAREQERVAFLG